MTQATPEKVAQIEEVKRKARQRVTVICTLLKTEGGQELIKTLKDQFCSKELSTGNPHDVVVKAAQHDVISFIEEIQKRGSEL